jgi:hypothetical protein
MNYEKFSSIESVSDLPDAVEFYAVAISQTCVVRQFGNLCFTEDILKKHAGDLTGKPVLLDHNQTAEGIVGSVVSSYYDDDKKAIIARVRIPKVGNERLIGLLNLSPSPISSVSIGAFIEKEERNGKYYVTNIEFKELSIVFEGADKNAKILRNDKRRTIMQGKITKEELSTMTNEDLSNVVETLCLQLEVAKKEIETLKREADIGRSYKEHLQKEAIRLVKLVEGESSPILKLIDKADVDTLKEIVDGFAEKGQEKFKAAAKTNLVNEEIVDSEKLMKLNYNELLNLREKFLGGN